MERFREIEADLQNKINEILGIDTLFDDYVKERNEYQKLLEVSFFAQRDELQQRIDKAIKLLKEDYFEDGSGNNVEEVIKILKGEE